MVSILLHDGKTVFTGLDLRVPLSRIHGRLLFLQPQGLLHLKQHVKKMTERRKQGGCEWYEVFSSSFFLQAMPSPEQGDGLRAIESCSSEYHRAANAMSHHGCSFT